MYKKPIFAVVWFAAVAATGMIFNCSQKLSQQDLFGYWKGRYNGRDFIIQFKDGENYVMSVVDQTVPGKYTSDFKQDPIQLAVVNQFGVKENIIIEFIDKDHLRFQSGGPDKPFPEEFDPGRSFILRRVADGKL